MATVSTLPAEESPVVEPTMPVKAGAGSPGTEERKEEASATETKAAEEGEEIKFTSVYEEEVDSPLKSIGVTASETRKDDSGEYTAYKVVATKEDGTTEEVWRRYNEFYQLNELFLADGVEAELPGKRLFGNMDPEFVAERQAGLDRFMKQLLAAKKAAESMTMKGFLRAAERPDWPACFGAINLAVHDLPHKSSVTEWWYYNTHLTSSEGREFSAFVCFFRVVKHVDKETGKRYYAHALNWAITDVESKKYYSDSLLDKDSPAMIKKILGREGEIEDTRLRRAMLEVLEKGNVPLPDRMFSPKRQPKCSTTSLDIDLEDATVTKDSAGNYVIKAAMPGGMHALNLTFAPKKAAVRHGLNGVVKGHDGDDMFYYFVPRCGVNGTIKVNGVGHVVAGNGWYDHEFGGKLNESDEAPDMQYAWNWAAVQLDNGMEVSAAVLVNPSTKKIMETRAVVVDPKGKRSQPKDLTLTALNKWRSCRSFCEYPTEWQLAMPSRGVDLKLKASFDDQEFMTVIAKPGFWEGRVDVTGTFDGAVVTGRGFVERNGFSTLKKLTTFFKGVGATVRQAVRKVYPDNPTYEEARYLVASEDTDHYMRGVPIKRLQEKLLEPVRTIADRGGKSWRSYGVLACVDVVGGDSRRYVDWLAMPEFMHVGSLIVDDIQDKSEVRRGGPCAHLIYGDALCINAGTAAYFQGQKLIEAPNLTPKQLNIMYDLYFAALRAGHAGQALDIAGLDYLMDDVVETGVIDTAEERILGIHMLKTAVPAGALAKMGAEGGGGTKMQVDAVGRYFESVGLAFQIMDDVLNLRGLYTNEADIKAKGPLKNVGEDITAGKVTIPIIKGLGRLKTKEERQKLWDTVASKPSDIETIHAVIMQLEDLGATQACVDQAITLVEDAWKVLDKAVPDSFAKIMLRSFGWFVIDRSN